MDLLHRSPPSARARARACSPTRGERAVVSALCILVVMTATTLAGEAMPEDFVYLRDVDPTIAQDMRYAGSRNFTEAPVPGYQAAECVLVRQAAEALKRVQDGLRAKDLTLKVYDCYRPTPVSYTHLRAHETKAN